MVYYYDPHYPAFASLFVLTGTTLADVVASPEFWFYCFIHFLMVIVVWIQKEANDAEPSLEQLPKDATFLTAGFLTFLVVFFNGQCYERYLELYKSCQAIDESTKLFVRELITFLYQPSIRRQVKLSAKYMLAAVFYFYFSLSDGGVDEQEWQLLEAKGLLTPHEMKYMKHFPGHRSLMITSWALRAVQHGLRTPELMKAFTPPERATLMNRLDDHVTNACKEMRRIGDLLAMPVPYAYFHLTSLVMVFNFVMVNWYLFAGFQTPLTIIPFCAYVLVFLGLRKLSAALADPFQPEDKDRLKCAMPCVAFLNNAFVNVLTLLETLDDSHCPDPNTRIARCNADAEGRADANFELDQLDMVTFNVPTDWDPEDDKGLSTLQKIQKRLFIGQQTHVAFKWQQMDPDAFMKKWLTDDRMTNRGSIIDTVKQEEKKDMSMDAASKPPILDEKKNPLQVVHELQDQNNQLIGMLEKRLSPRDAEMLKPKSSPSNPSTLPAADGLKNVHLTLPDDDAARPRWKARPKDDDADIGVASAPLMEAGLDMASNVKRVSSAENPAAKLPARKWGKGKKNNSGMPSHATG